MKTTISITGIKEIDNVLKQLPKELTHNVLSAAHAAAAKPLVTKMQLRAPEGPTGNLVDSIGIVKSSVKRANTIGEVKVGPRRKGRYRGHHAHLVEYGTGPRKKRESRRPGYKSRANPAKRNVMPKKPFAEPAFIDTKEIVKRRIATEVGRALSRTMRRYLR